VTDCLNFGNPEKPEVYWELSEAIDGLGEACRALNVPIVSGNVSLYNESNGVAVKPSPIVGMVGLIEDRSTIPSSGFVAEGDIVLLVGPVGAELGCSEYLSYRLGRTDDLGPPPGLDLEIERSVQAFVREAARRGLLRSAHDCSEGGLAVAIAECCIAGGIGFRGDADAWGDLSIEATFAFQPPQAGDLLFGEGQSRFVISYRPDDARALLDVFRATAGVSNEGGRRRVPLTRIGIVGGRNLAWSDASSDPLISVPIKELARAWNTPF
jgi:phosphoribosylformylglycinamidine synthase